MALKKLQLLRFIIIALVCCHMMCPCVAKEEVLATFTSKPSNILVITAANSSTTEKPSSNRSGRLMKIFYKDGKDLRISPRPKRFGSPTSRILSRSDHFPPPLVFQRRPFGGGGGGGLHLPMIRRVQNNIQPSIRQSYDNFKSSRYSPVKEAGLGPQYRPQFGNNLAYRPDGQQQQQHPNSLGQGQGTHSLQYVQNFKASPAFSGKAIVRPLVGDQQVLQQHEQYLQRQQKYTQQQQQQKYEQARDQYYAQQQQQQQLKQQLNQREQIPQQIQASKPFQDQSNNYQINLPVFSKTGPQNSYSVYEEPDLSERAQLQIAAAHNHDLSAKEAQEYLNFMGTNEYFLPKREPNFRKLDDERERLSKYQQQQQQQQQRSQFPQTQQQQRQIKYSKPVYDPVSSPSSTAQASTYSKPIEVSQLFYHGDSSPSSTIVRGSYQAGNNVFVVNSDGNKAIKHIVPNPLATTPRTVTSTQRYSSPLNRTPEPIRFEFTERDAISPATYTISPTSQLRNSIGQFVHSTPTPGTPTSKTTASLNYAGAGAGVIRPINENRGDTNNDDDPEDEEDMQEASSSDIFGRVPVKVPTKETSEEPPSEQKDTEDYCEKICSNIHDDDEEVVCGSDGYMYTSEAQMECYASCLHIDVTIQGKGSCSAR